jgi:hypothetical protein
MAETNEVGRWGELVGVSPHELVEMARQRTDALGLAPSSNDDRNVVNMLRHDYTDYDWHVQGTKTDRLYAQVLDAIACDFPWLAAQCEKDKATHHGRLSIGVQARRGAHIAAQRRQVEARATIKRLSIGGKVLVNWRGRQREGEVVEMRRTRIRVALPLDDGAIHVIDRSAHEVQPG